MEAELDWTTWRGVGCPAVADIRAPDRPVRNFAHYWQHSTSEISLNVPVS